MRWLITKHTIGLVGLKTVLSMQWYEIRKAIEWV